MNENKLSTQTRARIFAWKYRWPILIALLVFVIHGAVPEPSTRAKLEENSSLLVSSLKDSEVLAAVTVSSEAILSSAKAGDRLRLISSTGQLVASRAVVHSLPEPTGKDGSPAKNATELLVILTDKEAEIYASSLEYGHILAVIVP